MISKHLKTLGTGGWPARSAWMRSTPSWLFIAMLSWSNASLAENLLEEVSWKALPNQMVELRVRTSEMMPQPKSFTIDKPARISIDLPNTALGGVDRRQDFNTGPVRSLYVAEAGERTRIVLNLDTLSPYTTSLEGNELIVLVGQGAENAAASAPTAAVSPEPAEQPKKAMPRSIQELDFRRGDNGSGRVVIRLSDPKTVVDVRQEGPQIIADFKSTAVTEELLKRLDVTDFATPVNTIDTLRAGQDVRLIVSTGADYEQVAYQTDNVFTVEVKPYAPDAEELLELEQEKEIYTGQRLSLNFQDIETRAVLQLLADVSGLNVVVSDTVVGNVTLRLQNVPWDQALDIVLKTKGLAMRQHDNVVIVAPAAEIANRERQELEAMAQVEELAPLRSEFVQVNYAKAGVIAGLLRSEGAGSFLSDRGSVSVDERTNTLLVQDTIDKLGEVRRVVQRLDIPVRQVLIESRIVIVNDTFSRDIGVNVGFAYLEDYGSDGLIGVAGGAQAASDYTTGTTPSQLERLMVNLPVGSSSGGGDDDDDGGGGGGPTNRGNIGLSILDADFLLDLELQAVENEGRGEIISTPRVITANQSKATIKQGVEIPYQEATSSGATNISFKTAALSLEVTPLITPDDRVIMDLRVAKDSVGTEFAGVPAIDTREVQTQVLVNDGDTVVLGGIYETDDREAVTKVPFLGDLPFVGAAFRNRFLTDDKRELLIFVTPRILTDATDSY